jgi:hypothetical protein
VTLSYFARGLVQAFGAHFIVSTLVSLAVVVLWRRAATAPTRASVTALRLFVLRMLPSAAGLVAATLVGTGYAMWEVRVEGEFVGRFALGAAAGGLAVLAHAGARIVVVVWRTVQIRRELDASIEAPLAAHGLPAAVIDSAFPIVAIVGLVTSRLFVARSVLEACSSEEFEAVLAHERAHARQYDNLRRLAVAGAPDLLSVHPAGHRLEAAWMHAAELAADEAAAGGLDRGVHLAAALVKVARLATTIPSDPLPASALYRGEPITERVHRLLAPPPVSEVRRWPTWARIAVPAALLAGALALVPLLHAAGEQLLALGR